MGKCVQMKQEHFYHHFYGNLKIIITVGGGAYFSNAVCERGILNILYLKRFLAGALNSTCNCLHNKPVFLSCLLQIH